MQNAWPSPMPVSRKSSIGLVYIMASAKADFDLIESEDAQNHLIALYAAAEEQLQAA